MINNNNVIGNNGGVSVNNNNVLSLAQGTQPCQAIAKQFSLLNMVL